jgi:tRNA threonylcarbamoyladenosine biosynthesis protein TsaE
MKTELEDCVEVRRALAGVEIICHSRGEGQTQALAGVLAGVLQAGDLLALHGDLGSGKTCFVRGLAEGLQIPSGRVRSPSFTLINEYGGGRLPLYHIDLYRLELADVDRMALREYLYGDGICAVEWFERLGEQAPHLAVHFTFVAESERRLVATAHGRRYDELLLGVARHFGTRGENN